MKLSQERWPHLQVLPPRVDELERLEHTPPVFAHYEGCDDEAGPILRFLALDKNAFVIVNALVHKVVDLVWDLLSLIEKHLLLVVLPVEREVLHVDAVPMVVQLHARRVHNPLHFVGDNEFKILRSILVTDEQPILDLDDPN
ncbi:MAG: hypothetical protein ACPHUD_09120 [Porticoccaceae bacterium]